MDFNTCDLCHGTGAVLVYSQKIVKAIRDAKPWNYTRSTVVCSCQSSSRLGSRTREERPTYSAEQFCIDESAGWDWPGSLEQRKMDHERCVRDWLMARGTEVVGTFSLDEWGANHGG